MNLSFYQNYLGTTNNRQSLLGSGSSNSITPANNTPLVNPATGVVEIAVALYIEGAGAIACVGADGQSFVWNVPANFYLTVPVAQVSAIGTTCTGIHPIW